MIDKKEYEIITIIILYIWKELIYVQEVIQFQKKI